MVQQIRKEVGYTAWYRKSWYSYIYFNDLGEFDVFRANPRSSAARGFGGDMVIPMMMKLHILLPSALDQKTALHKVLE